MIILFVTLKTLRMIILNLSNILNNSLMFLLSYKNHFILNMIQLNVFWFILIITYNVFRSFLLELKIKYSFNYNNKFFNFVRYLLKIFDLIILKLVDYSRVVTSLLLSSLFCISIINQLTIIIVLSFMIFLL